MAETLIRLFEDPTNVGACRSCAARIVWHETLTGKKMPMNAGAVPRKSETDQATRRVVAFYSADDSHFNTCPDAARFSKKAGR